MISNDLLKQIEFIKEIDKIKYIQRRTKLFNSDRHENDAEHSWRLAMMAIVLSEYSDCKIDLFKVIKMVLIHDIVEIDAGWIHRRRHTSDRDTSKKDGKGIRKITRQMKMNLNIADKRKTEYPCKGFSGLSQNACKVLVGLMVKSVKFF